MAMPNWNHIQMTDMFDTTNLRIDFLKNQHLITGNWDRTVSEAQKDLNIFNKMIQTLAGEAQHNPLCEIGYAFFSLYEKHKAPSLYGGSRVQLMKGFYTASGDPDFTEKVLTMETRIEKKGFDSPELGLTLQGMGLAEINDYYEYLSHPAFAITTLLSEIFTSETALYFNVECDRYFTNLNITNKNYTFGFVAGTHHREPFKFILSKNGTRTMEKVEITFDPYVGFFKRVIRSQDLASLMMSEEWSEEEKLMIEVCGLKDELWLDSPEVLAIMSLPDLDTKGAPKCQLPF